MKTKYNFREIFVWLFMIFIHGLSLYIFVRGLSNRYYKLTSLSKILGVVIAAFTFFTIWLTSVYGKVDIGNKDESEMFQTISLNLLITDILSFAALKVMIYVKGMNWFKDIHILFLIFLVQIIVARILIKIARYFYFLNYPKENTLILNYDTKHLNEVMTYLKKNEKQYNVLDVLDNPSITDISLSDIENVIILGDNSKALNDLVLKCLFLDIVIVYESSMSSVLLTKSDTIVIDDILFFRYDTNPFDLYQRIMKRLIDIVFSLFALIVLSPIMLIVAIVIKLDDRGPAFYRQERFTKDGQTFEIVKFRSMKENSGHQQARKEDDRITRVGHYIRKFRLDELPQLINILKGEMSVVGPRPESCVLATEIMKEVPEFSYRLKVKAGLTGTAQILGKYNTAPKDKLMFDLHYINNFSLLNDIKLMFQTLIVFVKKDSTEGFD